MPTLSRKKEIRQEEIKPNTPLYNVKIELNGWQGPFNSINYFEGISKRLREAKNYQGPFTLLRCGSLIRGKDSRLHIHEGQMDIDSIDDWRHVHFNNGLLPIEIKYIRGPPHGLYFQEDHEAFEYEKSLSEKVMRHTTYTLEGLYSTLPRKNDASKMRAIINELEKRNLLEGLIEINSPLSPLLNFFEHSYKALISNQ